ncbi:MAG: hypothetical protein ACLSVD_05230 [Eggerthellaceae bacterium]
MEQQIKREVATQTATAGEASAPRKREVAAAPSRAGLSTQDLILIAVLHRGRGAQADGGLAALVDGHEAELHHRDVLPGHHPDPSEAGTGPGHRPAGRPHLPDPC